MKTYHLLLAMGVLLNSAPAGYGMATERIGPDKDQRFPTVAQPGWPAGMINILGHDSRVYSIEVNGNENFYFQAKPGEISELIKLYCETRLRDHVVIVKTGKKEVSTFKGNKIDYNVNLHYLGGIALFMSRRKGAAETFEPTLTIYVDADAHEALSKQIAIPSHVIFDSEVAGWETNSKATKPNRRLWHAEVIFDDKTPAADFENGVSTTVTLWEEGAETGFNLGQVSREGKFSAAFSDREIATLEAGKMWLTLTVGNYMTVAKKDDPRLDVEDMLPDPADPVKLTLVEVAKPRYYFGRLLFEDGSPAILDPPPWPGAEISINFPYSGRNTIDKQGYFRVFFTPEQFATLKTQRSRKNIYIPDFDTTGRSTARFAFPAEKLSLDKAEAGEMRIAKPRRKDQDK